MASIVKMLNKQIEELEWIDAQKLQVLTSLENICSSAVLDLTTISSSNGYLQKLGHQAINQNRVIENTKNIMKMKQLEINEAYKKVKVLEKLKEKQEEEYYRIYEEKMSKEIDDIATSRYKAG